MLMALVFSALWPHMIRQIRVGGMQTPLPNLMVMVLLMEAKSLVRMAYWDLGASIRRAMDLGRWLTPEVHIGVVNGGLNMMLILALIFGLRFAYYAIPERDRGDWSLLTAPFYPHRFWLFFMRRD